VLLRRDATKVNVDSSVRALTCRSSSVPLDRTLSTISVYAPLTSVDFHPNGSLVAVGTMGQNAAVYDLRDPKQKLAHLVNAEHGNVYSVRFDLGPNPAASNAAAARPTTLAHEVRRRAADSAVVDTDTRLSRLGEQRHEHVRSANDTFTAHVVVVVGHDAHRRRHSPVGDTNAAGSIARAFSLVCVGNEGEHGHDIHWTRRCDRAECLGQFGQFGQWPHSSQRSAVLFA
jgi:hypothetical protein